MQSSSRATWLLLFVECPLWNTLCPEHFLKLGTLEKAALGCVHPPWVHVTRRMKETLWCSFMLFYFSSFCNELLAPICSIKSSHWFKRKRVRIFLVFLQYLHPILFFAVCSDSGHCNMQTPYDTWAFPSPATRVTMSGCETLLIFYHWWYI